MKPIAILGVGPAGLLAAHAVALGGRPIALFSQPGVDGKISKSRLGGAQFLHCPIPKVTTVEPEAVVRYKLHGSSDVYRVKVYGEDPIVPFVSMQFLEPGKEQPVWNMQKAYDYLWELLGADDANAATINSKWIEDNRDSFDMIISSVPAPALCAGPAFTPHNFNTHRIWIAPKALAPIDDFTIVYDGTFDHGYYRMSKLFGVGGTEFPDRRKPPIPDLIRADKPIRTNCDCHPDVIRVGRFGTWTKGVLIHDAFIRTLDAFGIKWTPPKWEG